MHVNRRTFLQRSACMALGTAAVTSTLTDLLKIGAVAQAADDYKALVCVFLYGGNDGNNLVIPRSASDYSAYAAARGVLAIPESQLLPISPLTTDGRDWALHPSVPELQALFAQKKLAILANVGPLLAPLTRAEWEADSVAVPPQLFSHSDQTVHWQTSVPDQTPRTGWGGRMADKLRSLNTGATLSMAFSLAGANTFQVGELVLPNQLSQSGSLGLDSYDPAGGDAVSAAINAILGLDREHLFEQAFRDTTRRAIDNDVLVRTALAGAPPLATVFPDTSLGRQLRMIARLISARSGLGLKRQLFFCATGGYDTHGPQLDAHAGLLTDLSRCLKAFYDATVEMGAAGAVTAFTASDFSRTYPSNGEGSDHGWGGHHLIAGGGVKGGEVFGKMPVLEEDGPDDTSDGRWIPTTSVDEYSATLARWFGVSSADMSGVLPNLGRFNRTDLGFMSY